MPAESKHIFRFDGLEYWAEGGCVVLYDSRDGTSKNITPADFLDRATALGRMAARAGYPSERDKFLRAANEMERCAKEAHDQGDPTDPKASEYARRHQTYKKIMALVPANTSNLILPKKPSIILGRSSVN